MARDEAGEELAYRRIRRPQDLASWEPCSLTRMGREAKSKSICPQPPSFKMMRVTIRSTWSKKRAMWGSVRMRSRISLL